jgi:hypothetical protein
MNCDRFNTSPRTLKIELLAIDLSTCSRCTGTLVNIEQAISTLKQVLAITGTVVQFDKILVESEAKAKQLNFISSPTVRINDRDITLETTESFCSDCSEICGSKEGTACRTWSYQGEIHTEAPVGAILDAMLREIYQNQNASPVSVVPSENFEVPQNLQKFFRDKAEKASSACRC